MTDAVRTRVIDVLQSASVKGSVPITERVLNEVANQAIAAKPGRVKQFDIQIGTENYLEAGVRVSIGPITKWFRPEIVVTAAASVITFTLASREYGSVDVARRTVCKGTPAGGGSNQWEADHTGSSGRAAACRLQVITEWPYIHEYYNTQGNDGGGF